MMTLQKHTFLYDEHIKLGAKMVDFAGWEMPIQYSSILNEHKTVRNEVGIFDVSHMGEVFVKGNDALDFLQKIVPQDISKLQLKRAVYCQLTNEKAGIIDDLIIYYLEENFYLLIINASRVKEDFEWMSQNAQEFENIELTNISDDYSLIAVQGPNSTKVMNKLGLNFDLQPEYFSILSTNLQDIDLYVSRTGYTGEDGFELLMKNEDAKKMWNILLEEGKEFGLLPIGLGARDVLRLEAALMLYGQDMDETTTPIEASLGWSIPKDKIADYNGKNIILNQMENKPQKRLIALKMLDRAIARHGYEVYYNDEKIGVVTSGGVAPSINENIALAYTNVSLKINDEIFVKIRDKFCKAIVVKKPFVPKVNKITT